MNKYSSIYIQELSKRAGIGSILSKLKNFSIGATGGYLHGLANPFAILGDAIKGWAPNSKIPDHLSQILDKALYNPAGKIINLADHIKTEDGQKIVTSGNIGAGLGTLAGNATVLGSPIFAAHRALSQQKAD